MLPQTSMADIHKMNDWQQSASSSRLTVSTHAPIQEERPAVSSQDTTVKTSVAGGASALSAGNNTKNDPHPHALDGSYVSFSADHVWKSFIMSNTLPDAVYVEVGMHSAKDTLLAANAGITVHGVEPSPKNFANVLKKAGGYANVHLHNAAAASKSGEKLPFLSQGSTGDHVGTADMWEMKMGTTTKNTSAVAVADNQNVVYVQSLAIDDLIDKEISPKRVDLLKIDTQGFEPSVFAGLHDSIRQHKIRFIISEFWPKGMDLLAQSKTRCGPAVEILQFLADSGYTVYPLAMQAHPVAGSGWVSFKYNRPFDDYMDHCMFYYDLEQKVPNPNYKMGYWADILAVAPGESVPCLKNRC